MQKLKTRLNPITMTTTTTTHTPTSPTGMTGGIQMDQLETLFKLSEKEGNAHDAVHSNPMTFKNASTGFRFLSPLLHSIMLPPDLSRSS